MLTRKALVLARVEDAYGVCSVAPSASAHALQVWDLELKPEGEDLQRNVYRDQLDPTASVLGRKKMGVSFKTELKGNGLAAIGCADYMPRVGALLRACGLVMSADPETSSGDFDGGLDFSTRSESFESATLIVFRDGVMHTIRGCRGTFDLEVPAGGFGRLSFDLSGRYQTPIDSATPTASYETTTPPRPGQSAGSFLVDSYAACVGNFSISRGNELADKVCLNSSEGLFEVVISDFTVHGKIDPDAVPLATNDWWTDWEDSTTRRLNLVLGAAANQRVTVTLPQAQLTSIAYDDDNGQLKQPLEFRGTDDGANGYSLKIRFH